MKHRIACTLAAVTVSSAASADFVEVVAEDVSVAVGTPAGLRTYRVYAMFDDPADQLLAIAGYQDFPGLLFETDAPDGLVNDGGPFSGLKEEDFVWFPGFGAPWDSWVTIGATTLVGNDTDYSPGFAGSDGVHNVIKGTSFSHPVNGGWYDRWPDGSPETGGSILIAQFTIAEGYDFLLQGTVDYYPGGTPPHASTPFLVVACSPPPPCYGACCLHEAGTDFCRYTTEAECLADDGIFLGIGTSCADCDGGTECDYVAPGPPCDTCPPDVNGNGTVGYGDLLAILSAWGPCPPGFPPDLDGSGDVGFEDLLEVLSNWGPCP